MRKHDRKKAISDTLFAFQNPRQISVHFRCVRWQKSTCASLMMLVKAFQSVDLTVFWWAK